MRRAQARPAKRSMGRRPRPAAKHARSLARLFAACATRKFCLRRRRNRTAPKCRGLCAPSCSPRCSRPTEGRRGPGTMRFSRGQRGSLSRAQSWRRRGRHAGASAGAAAAKANRRYERAPPIFTIRGSESLRHLSNRSASIRRGTFSSPARVASAPAEFEDELSFGGQIILLETQCGVGSRAGEDGTIFISPRRASAKSVGVQHTSRRICSICCRCTRCRRMPSEAGGFLAERKRRPPCLAAPSAALVAATKTGRKVRRPFIRDRHEDHREASPFSRKIPHRF